MNTLNLKPSHKTVADYYKNLDNLSNLGVSHEGAVKSTFAMILRDCAKQFNLTLSEEYPIKRHKSHIRVDGALVNSFNLACGYWEAKDIKDDLAIQVKKKIAQGYPLDNILFQSPNHVIIYQNSKVVFNENISKPGNLIECLKIFFEYEPPAIEQWLKAVDEFKLKVSGLATGLLNLIEKERRTNKQFIKAFDEFSQLCHVAINPNISVAAIEEMLIQHLLTERIFRQVFDNPEFVQRNVIAKEIEKVIVALTSQSFSRHDFLKSLDRFYTAIEIAAASNDDFYQKQGFLNTVYEKFFQGYSVKNADKYGIVYTPQPIVNFMVKSVEHILIKDFNNSLSGENIQIIDPFVGTGSFIVRILHEIKRSKLEQKYGSEIYCNEVMLLPYYIASMNIEHEYSELINKYKPFEGVCLVDTFELAEGKQLSLLTEGNTARVIQQQKSPIFIVISNPPYNAGQINENDNNKNRKYPAIDKRVSSTYGKESKATLLRKLSDPYIKAIRWASDRIGDEGIVAFITNSSFVDGITFDAMRRCLEHDFDKIYIIDLGGNVKKNPKLSGTTHNVFGIQVGVSINFFIRKKHDTELPRKSKIYYTHVDEFWRKEQKYDFLNEKGSTEHIEWQEISPDSKYNWLTAGMDSSFDSFIPLGTKEAKSEGINSLTVFKTFSLGVGTNRDEWVYNFQNDDLEKNVNRLIKNYNYEVYRFSQNKQVLNIDDFVNNDPSFVKWTDRLKTALMNRETLSFDSLKVRLSMYRPFCRQFLYFDHLLNQRRYLQHTIFPNANSETENCVICVTQTSEKPFVCLATNVIPNLVMCGGFGAATQCFPLFTYSEDGTNRQDNITDWVLIRFQEHYHDNHISKRDIFHYVYAILHHSQYREKYAANLKRELPRILFAPDFWEFTKAGKHLAEIHVNYEKQKEHPLTWLENKDAKVNYRVERMALSTDKMQIVYNDFITLCGIPPEVFEYRLGNRSAIEWIIDQYQFKTNTHSNIVTDPNKLDDEQYILKLIGKVITVSLKTVKILTELPPI